MANYLRSGQFDNMQTSKDADILGLDGQRTWVAGRLRLSKIGNIGFQLEGGVITVDASSGEVDVNFDRPMTYQGGLVTPPAGVGWYFNGYPLLANGTRTLHLPVTGMGQPPPPFTGSASTDPAPAKPSGAAQGDQPPLAVNGLAVPQ